MLDSEIVDDKNLPHSTSMASMTDAHPTPLQLSTNHGNQRWRHLLGLVAVITVLAALVVNHDWRFQQPGASRMWADIRSAVELEAWAWQTGNEALATSALDPQAPAGWLRQARNQQQRRYGSGSIATPIETLHDVELRGDVALVEVVITQPGSTGATLYRETRFYRQVGAGRWRRTAPVSEFWGARRVIDTEHFRFEFRQRDAAAVQAAAPQVEAMYLGLRRDAGLGPPPVGEKLTIKLRVAASPHVDVADMHFEQRELTLSPPAILPIPLNNLSDSEALTQYIRHPLSERVLHEAFDGAVVNRTWTFVVEGLYRWLAREGGVLPAEQQPDVPSALQQQLAEKPLRLVDLMLPESAPGYWPDRWRSRTAQRVIAYGVSTYGRERLPAFIDGLGRYDSWEALIPAVFGVPAREFEAGWQAYLADYSDR